MADKQHTKDMLGDALEAAELPEMAAKARTGYYHDYLSPLDFPAMQLAEELRNVGTSKAMALRRRVVNGDFDASLEEHKEWAASPDGQAARAMLPIGLRKGMGFKD